MSFLFFVDYLVFVTANQLLALFFDLFRETFHILRIQWRHPAMRELSGRGGGVVIRRGVLLMSFKNAVSLFYLNNLQ